MNVTWNKAEKWGWRMLMPALLFGGVAAGYVLLLVLVMRLVGWRKHRSGQPWAWPEGGAWWIGYYGFQLLGGLWSQNMDSWGLSLEVKAALVFLPLISALPGRPLLRDFWWSVGWSVTAYLTLRFANATWHSLVLGDLSWWRYARFAGDVHPTYLSLHVAVAWLGLGRHWAGGGASWQRTLLLILLAVSLGMMGSKAGILAAVVVALLDLVLRKRWGSGRVNQTQPVWAILLFLGLLGTSGYALSKARFMEMKTVAAVAEQGGAAASSSTAGRVAVWVTAVELIVEKPLGVGTGDVTDELMTRYTRDGVTYASERRLNPHNQWLQAGVAFGWPGIVLITLALGSWVWRGWCRRDAVLFLTGVLLVLHASVESVLEVQRGVVFVMWMFVALKSSADHN